MSLSKAEIDDIAGEAGNADVRRMLEALPDFEFQAKRAKPLARLCAAGADYGWRELERTAKLGLTDLSARAKASLRRDLRRDLEEITRPCLDLEWKSFGLAMTSIGLLPEKPDPRLTERRFLRDKPSHRLFSLFRKFPVLARLWSQLISQWREHVMEVLLRLAADRRALSRVFFSEPVGEIVNVQLRLSDRHNSGRTVARLQFEAGSIIYKPRAGDGEWEWGSLLEWMNAQSFQPTLRVGRVVRRKSYCWMERIEAGPRKNRAEARRFYERIGGLIAAAYLLRAVDCHRDNLIASGEDPVLVDADALWHVSPTPKTRSPFDVLSRTGFFPGSNLRSLQSRSSVLSRANPGGEAAQIGAKPLSAMQYEREIVRGFRRAWHCILGTQDRRKAFTRRLRRIQSRKRRWIYRATEKYAAIQRASIQPGAFRSAAERYLLITRLSRRNTVDPEVVEAEIDALARLDIPYFLRSRKEPLPLERGNIPKDTRDALRQLLA